MKYIFCSSTAEKLCKMKWKLCEKKNSESWKAYGIFHFLLDPLQLLNTVFNVNKSDRDNNLHEEEFQSVCFTENAANILHMAVNCI